MVEVTNCTNPLNSLLAALAQFDVLLPSQAKQQQYAGVPFRKANFVFLFHILTGCVVRRITLLHKWQDWFAHQPSIKYVCSIWHFPPFAFHIGKMLNTYYGITCQPLLYLHIWFLWDFTHLVMSYTSCGVSKYVLGVLHFMWELSTLWDPSNNKQVQLPADT